MVSSRRAAAAPAPAAAAAPGPDEEEVKGNAEGRKLSAEDEAYLRIQLEEIVVVKNEDVTRLAAARGGNYLGGASSRACEPGAAAAAGPAPAVSSAGTATAAAAVEARGALSTTVGWIVGSN